MLGWLTDNFDAAATRHALQALASFVVSGEALATALVLGLIGFAAAILAIRAKPGSPSFPSKESDLARATAAYRAQLPAGATRMDFEIANAEAALMALVAQRKSAGKAQRASLAVALSKAAEGDFDPARSVFEDIVAKEKSRWRPQRPKMAAALRHLGTCARITDADAARAAFAGACELEPTNETSLTMLAKLQLEAGRLTEAEPVLDRLVSLADRDSDPHALVYGLILRGDCRAMQGRLASAAGDYQRSSEICRGQPQGSEPSLDWQRPLALAYGCLGDVLLRQKKPDEAFEQFEAAHRIQEQLVRDAPASIDTLRDLAGSCDRIGDLQLLNGDVEAALKSFGDARSLAQRLAEANPGHAELQRDFAVSCCRIGEVLRLMGRLPEALEAFRDDLAISSRLADAAPADEHCQRDLAVSYANVGDILCALGHAHEALVSFEAAKAILSRLHESAPSDEVREHELALMHTRVGSAHAKLNAHTDALEAYNAVLANAEARAEATPDDSARLRELAHAHTRIGNLHLAAGKLDHAVESFDAAREIVERIPEANGESVELRRERALCHGRIAMARARSDARDDALAAFQAGHNLLAGLNGGSEVLVADDKAWFAGQIAALEVTQTFTFRPLSAPKSPADMAEPQVAPPAVTVR